MRTPSDKYLKEIADKLDVNSLARLAAHVVLSQQYKLCEEMGHDKGNDPMTRAQCLFATTDADELFNMAADDTYQLLTEEEWFDEVSKAMVEIKAQYI